jgi:hypothetical protein
LNSPQIQQWDEKQLVAALERASLTDLQKLLKVQPVKSASSVRRGRFSPPVEAVANIRLDVVYVCVEGNGLMGREEPRERKIRLFFFLS